MNATLLCESSRSSVSRSEEHTSELQSRLHLVCRLLLEKKHISLAAFEDRSRRVRRVGTGGGRYSDAAIGTRRDHLTRSNTDRLLAQTVLLGSRRHTSRRQ